MANNISPSKIIHYISQRKRILVGRNNQPNQQLLKFDYRLTDTYNFQVVNQINQIVSLSGSYKLYGSYIDNKQNLHILFDATSEPIGADNVLTFNVDTYTSQFMNFVKNQKQIDVSIVKMEGEVATEMTLRDIAIAYPRPYIEGVTPREIVQRVILSFNNPVSGAFAAGDQFENVAYDINTFALGTGLDTITKNQLVIGSYNQQDPDAAFIIGNGTIDDRKNIFTVDLSGNVQAGAISATDIFVEGSNYKDTVDQQFAATSTWITDTFETKESSTQTFNELEGDIDQISSFVSGLPADIATKANQTDLEALSGTVEGLAETKADLSSVYTKENVYPAWQTDQLIEAATSGKADLSALTDYATQQWVEDKNYTTGYTAGSGIQINNNVISLTGQLGETYTADNDTLKLVNNQFSIKSVFPMIKSAGGVTITKDSEGITYLKVTTSGGGGGSSTEYFAGTGLELGSDPELPETTFSINTTWLAAQISAATSGLENYSAGTGISIDANNVISVTGMVTTDQIANMATTGWVTGYCSSFITETTLNDYATKVDVLTSLHKYTSGKANKDDLNDYTQTSALNDYLSTGILTGYVTDQQLETTSSNIIDTLSSVSGTLSSALTSNVETLSTAIDTKTTAQQVTGLITGYVAQNLSAVSQLVNDTGFITLASLDDYALTSDIPVVTDFVTEDELSNTSTAIVNLIPDTSDLATEQDLQAVSAVVSAKADKSYVDQTFLSAIPDEYVTATELTTELQPYALSANVDTSIAAATGIVTSWVDTQHYLTAHQSLDNYYNKTEVDTAIETASGNIETWVGQQGYLTAHQSLDAYATQQWVEDKHYLTGVDLTNYATKGQIPTKVSDLENDKGYITGITSTQVTDALGFTPVSTDTTYTAGSGLELVGTEFKLTAAIPSIEGLASEQYVQTEIGKIDIPTKTSDLENDSEFATSSYVTGQIRNTLTTYINATTGWVIEQHYATTGALNDIATGLVELSTTVGNLDIPTDEDISGIASAVTTGYLEDYDTSSEVDDKITAAIAQIDFPEGVNYTAGEGLGLSSTQNGKEFYLTAHIPTNDEITGLASSYVDTLNIATTYATKDELGSKADQVDFASVCGVLSGAIDFVSGVVDDINVPTKISDLENDSEFATSGNVETIIANTSSTIINGLATESYVGTQIENTSATIINGLATESFVTSQGYQDADDVSGIVKEMSTAIRVDLATTSELPTKTSDLTNDSEYITSGQVDTKIADTSATIINGLATQSYVTTQIANTSANIIDGLASESYVTTQIQNTSASIINGLATESYVGTQIANTSATIIDGLATETYVTSQGYQTAIDVSNIITTDVDSSYVSSLGFATTTALADKANQSEFASVCGVFSAAITGKANTTDVYSKTSADAIFATKNEIPDVTDFITSGDAKTQIEAYNYQTSAQVEEIADDKISTSVSGLLSAGTNVTFSVNEGITTINATGGGGSVNLSGGSGIRITQVGDTTVISIATAAINASSADFTFDFRNGTSTSSVLYTEYTGADTPTISYTGTLPSGITTGLVPSGISFTATSAANVGNNISTINVTFDAIDVFHAVTVPVEITTIGYVSASVTATSATYTFDGSVATETYTFNFSYDGSDTNIDVQISGDLPAGVTATSSFNSATGSGSITFTGVAEDYVLATTSHINIVFNAIDIDETVKAVDIVLVNVETPVTLDTPFTIEATDDGTFGFRKYGSPDTPTLYYKKNAAQSWSTYTPDTYINLVSGDILSFSGTTSTWSKSWDDYFACSGTCHFKVYGNLFSLMNKQIPNTSGDIFSRLFIRSLVVDAKKLLIVADTYLNRWFASLFYSCTSLTAVPILSATTISGWVFGDGCFNGCTALSTVPYNMLPATNLYSIGHDGPYDSFFKDCSNLVEGPYLPSPSASKAAYKYMFQGCSKLSSVSVGLTTWDENPTGYGVYSNGWLKNVASNGVFNCPAALPKNTGQFYIPTNWTINEIS